MTTMMMIDDDQVQGMSLIIYNIYILYIIGRSVGTKVGGQEAEA